MVGQGRLVGTVLLAVALIALLISIALMAAQLAEHVVTPSGAVLGILLVTVILVLPLGGGGIYLMSKGRQEQVEYSEVEQEKKVLNMVLAQGKVTLPEVALELNVPRAKVEDYVRDLVGKNLFSGAINWQDGVLYSRQASEMKADQKCPNCGGQLQLVGKGMIKCPYCGSEVFLAK